MVLRPSEVPWFVVVKGEVVRKVNVEIELSITIKVWGMHAEVDLLSVVEEVGEGEIKLCAFSSSIPTF